MKKPEIHVLIVFILFSLMFILVLTKLIQVNKQIKQKFDEIDKTNQLLEKKLEEYNQQEIKIITKYSDEKKKIISYRINDIDSGIREIAIRKR